MAPVSTDGSVKYWLEGLPRIDNRKAVSVTTGIGYWLEGLPHLSYDTGTGGGGGGVVRQRRALSLLGTRTGTRQVQP